MAEGEPHGHLMPGHRIQRRSSGQVVTVIASQHQGSPATIRDAEGNEYEINDLNHQVYMVKNWIVLQADEGHRGMRKILAGAAGIAALGIGLAACGGSSGSSRGNSWYQAGFTFGSAAANYSMSGPAAAFGQYYTGGSAEYACYQMAQLGPSGVEQASGNSVLQRALPPPNGNNSTDATEGDQWINGCVAGYEG